MQKPGTYASWDDVNRSRERDGDKTHRLLKSALARAKGERAMMRFFKLRPHVVAFSQFWYGHNDLHVFFEFKLGAERSIDILVLGCHSGGWCPTLIEVQDPHAKLFLKSGDPAHQLREGVRQITQWRDVIHRNQQVFRQELSRRLPADAAAHGRRHTSARTEVLDPREYFEFNWWVLIGRSSQMSEKDHSDRRLHASSLNGVNVASFDRLLKKWAPDS